MTRTKIVTTLLLGSLVVAVAVGALVYRSATAATPTPSALTNNSAVPFGRGFGGGMKGGLGGYTSEDLANALGITVDELSTAQQNAYAAALKQAVEQGLITQAQADQLSANGSAFPFGGRWDAWLSQNGIDFNALLADALGITVDKLEAAYTQAYNARIDQAVADGNLTQEQADLMKGQRAVYADKTFQASMQTAFEDAVKQAVSDSVITQAQADLILQNQAGMGFGGPGGFGGAHGFGPLDGGRGFGPHNWMGGGPNQTVPAAPTATP
jgi:polyhydroxyalkanoate synthesis regulator phasin